MRNRRVLTVAGSDPTGGAGMQADVRTLQALGVSASAVISAVTVQDGLRVARVQAVAAAVVAEQLIAVDRALRVDVVKTGLLANTAIIRAVAAHVDRTGVALIVDPVSIASGGDSLVGPGYLRALRAQLLPIAACVTPNLSEAEALTGETIVTSAQMREAARAIAQLGPAAVVVTGGHLAGRPCDVLWDGRRMHEIGAPRVAQRAMHGTGCAYASALAAYRARGASWSTAAQGAGDHVRSLIRMAERGRNGTWHRR